MTSEAVTHEGDRRNSREFSACLIPSLRARPFHDTELEVTPPTTWKLPCSADNRSDVSSTTSDKMNKVRQSARAALTFFTDREMFSKMRSFTLSWSITGLLAARGRLSADSHSTALVLLTLTPPGLASDHDQKQLSNDRAEADSCKHGVAVCFETEPLCHKSHVNACEAAGCVDLCQRVLRVRLARSRSHQTFER